MRLSRSEFITGCENLKEMKYEIDHIIDFLGGGEMVFDRWFDSFYNLFHNACDPPRIESDVTALDWFVFENDFGRLGLELVYPDEDGEDVIYKIDNASEMYDFLTNQWDRK